MELAVAAVRAREQAAIAALLEARAHAAFALGEVGDARALRALEALAGDERPARVYAGDELVTKQVREWAGEALARLRAA